MSERIITLTEAQRLLKSLSEQSSEETLVITKRGQPLLTLMPYHSHQELLANIASLQTILEIMLGGVKTTPRTHQPAKASPEHGKNTSWEEFKEKVGWE